MRGSLLLIPLALSLGCQDPDFNTPDLLKNPRILAVQAEPPQPSFGQPTTLRALIYLPSPRADAAECVGTDVGPKYQWSWCPLPTSSANAYECPIQQNELDQLFAMLGLAQGPQLDLGTAETATLHNPFPAPLLHSLCKGEFQMPSAPLPSGSNSSGVDAGATSIFSCQFSQGDDRKQSLSEKRPLAFPVTVKLKYTPPCGSPAQDNYGSELSTVFTVRLPTDDTVPPDQNPTVGDLWAASGFNPDAAVPGTGSDAPVPPDAGAGDDGGGTEGIDGGTAIDGGSQSVDGGQPTRAPEPVTPPEGSVLMGTRMFPRQQRVGLWLDLPMSASEPLPRPSTRDEPSAGNILYAERLSTVWYAEAGEFGGQHGNNGSNGGYLPPYNQTTTDEPQLDKNARRTFWALPTHEDYPYDTAKVVVVVRDSRGGVAWASGVATLEDRP